MSEVADALARLIDQAVNTAGDEAGRRRAISDGETVAAALTRCLDQRPDRCCYWGSELPTAAQEGDHWHVTEARPGDVPPVRCAT